jgi:hypothetical protein
MRTSWKNILYLAGLVVGVLLFGLQVVSGYRAVTATSTPAELSALIVGWMAIILAFFLQMMIWRGLMQELGSHLTRLTVIQGYPITFLPRYIPGTIWGYMTRGQWLYRDHQIPYLISSFGSLNEILASVVSVALVVGLSGIILGWEWGGLWLSVSGLFMIGTWYVLHKVDRVPALRKRLQLPTQEIDSPTRRVGFIAWLKTVLGYMGLWVCYGFMLLVVASTSFSDTRINIVSCTLLYSLSWLIGFLVVFIPAGLGLREFALTFLFMSYFEIDFGTASAISVTSRFLVILGELAWVIVGIILKVLRAKLQGTT